MKGLSHLTSSVLIHGSRLILSEEYVAIENMDHLIASHVAGRMASWLMWIAELGHSISPLLNPFRMVHAHH